MFLRFKDIVISACLVCLSMSTHCFAQSFVDESHRWTYSLIYQVPQNKVDTVTYEAIFNGIVLIDDRDYHEAFERIALDENSDWESLGYYRQEEAKVYYRDKNSSKEYLLYDFALDRIGDTFTFPDKWVSYGFDLNLEVIKIDSIYLKNGERRKRITLRLLNLEGKEDTYWIDGIGSEDSPLFPFSLVNEDFDFGNRKLQCFFTNDEHLLQQNPSGQCAYLIVDVDNVMIPAELNKFRVFPNPISKGDPLFLSGNLDNLQSQLHISIYNTIGERVYQSTARSTDPIVLNHKTDTGIYYYIINSDNTWYYGNFIIID